jgi:hypothetical protein
MSVRNINLQAAGKLCGHAETLLVRTSGTNSVYLVGLVQPNKRDKPDKPNNGVLMLADFFSILLERHS